MTTRELIFLLSGLLTGSAITRVGILWSVSRRLNRERDITLVPGNQAFDTASSITVGGVTFYRVRPMGEQL